MRTNSTTSEVSCFRFTIGKLERDISLRIAASKSLGGYDNRLDAGENFRFVLLRFVLQRRELFTAQILVATSWFDSSQLLRSRL